jgi:hypothetical protein
MYNEISRVESRDVFVPLKITLTDERSEGSSVEVSKLSDEIARAQVGKWLREFQKGFNRYVINVEKIGICLIDGELGDGEVSGGKVCVALPEHEEMIGQTKKHLGVDSVQSSIEDIEKVAYTVATSVVLHESTHKLIESSPGSSLHAKLEELRDKEDSDAKYSTFVDELIVVAVQRLFNKMHAFKQLSKESDEIYVAADHLAGATLSMLKGEMDIDGYLQEVHNQALSIYEENE